MQKQLPVPPPPASVAGERDSSLGHWLGSPSSAGHSRRLRRAFVCRDAARQALTAAGSAGARDVFLSCEGQCLERSPLPVFHPPLPLGMPMALLCACKISPERRLSLWQLGRASGGRRTTQRPRLGCSRTLMNRKRERRSSEWGPWCREHRGS